MLRTHHHRSLLVPQTQQSQTSFRKSTPHTGLGSTTKDKESTLPANNSERRRTSSIMSATELYSATVQTAKMVAAPSFMMDTPRRQALATLCGNENGRPSTPKKTPAPLKLAPTRNAGKLEGWVVDRSGSSSSFATRRASLTANTLRRVISPTDAATQPPTPSTADSEFFCCGEESSPPLPSVHEEVQDERHGSWLDFDETPVAEQFEAPAQDRFSKAFGKPRTPKAQAFDGLESSPFALPTLVPRWERRLSVGVEASPRSKRLRSVEGSSNEPSPMKRRARAGSMGTNLAFTSTPPRDSILVASRRFHCPTSSWASSSTLSLTTATTPDSSFDHSHSNSHSSISSWYDLMAEDLWQGDENVDEEPMSTGGRDEPGKLFPRARDGARVEAVGKLVLGGVLNGKESKEPKDVRKGRAKKWVKGVSALRF